LHVTRPEAAFARGIAALQKPYGRSRICSRMLRAIQSMPLMSMPFSVRSRAKRSIFVVIVLVIG
jgi:hypothetical protein